MPTDVATTVCALSLAATVTLLLTWPGPPRSPCGHDRHRHATPEGIVFCMAMRADWS